MAKKSTKVVSTPVTDVKSAKKGSKRGANWAIEKVVSAKQQKLENDETVEANQEPGKKQPNKVESNLSEEASKPEVVEHTAVLATNQSLVVKNAKEYSFDSLNASGSDVSDKNSEATEEQFSAAVENGTKEDTSGYQSDSGSDSKSLDEEANGTEQAKDDEPSNASVANDEESEESEGSEGSEGSEDDLFLETPKKTDTDVEMVDASKSQSKKSDVSTAQRTARTPTTQACGSKTLFVGNLPSEVEENDVREFFQTVAEVIEVRLASGPNVRFMGFGHAVFATPEDAQKALDSLNGERLLNHPVKLELANERGAASLAAFLTGPDKSLAKDESKTPASQDCGSKTLFVGNLSFKIKENDLREFFKTVAEVVDVRLAHRRNGNVKGFGHVEFATLEDAQKALDSLNGKHLLNRPVKLEVAHERDAASLTAFVTGFDKSLGKDEDTNVEMVDASQIPSKTPDMTTPKRIHKASTSVACGSKTLFVGNLSFKVKENDLREFFKTVAEVVDVRLTTRSNGESKGFGHVEFATPEDAQKALDSLNGERLLNRPVNLKLAFEKGNKRGANVAIEKVLSAKKQKIESSKSEEAKKVNDEDSEESKKSDGHSVEISMKKHKTSASQAHGSKQLFLGNLSSKVKENDVREFFKTVAKVVEVRLASDTNGKFKGFGHAEFATPEDAQKALDSLNGECLLNRPVNIEVAHERETSSLTAFVTGFDKSLQEDEIRNALQDHFQSCGNITRMSIPPDFKTGGVRGMAFIDFEDNSGFNKALELDTSEVKGWKLVVTGATKPNVKLASSIGESNGFGCVELSTPKDAQKVLDSLHGEHLLNRPMNIDVAHEREAASLTAFVTGFDKSLAEDEIRNALQDHFRSCGNITRMSIPPDLKKGGVRGMAFINFEDSNGFNKALQLDGSEVRGWQLVVTESVKPNVKLASHSNREPKGLGHVELSTPEVAQKAPSIASFLTGCDKSLAKDEPKAPASQARGSKTLFIGNISFKVKENDVREFFETVAEVVEVRLASDPNGKLKGFGHVEFATPQDAQKALDSLNGKHLLNRPVNLDLASEKSSYTPNNRENKGVGAPSRTAFVKGFDKSLPEDEIRCVLQNHFGSCGNITRLSIPSDFENGGVMGWAYIDFEDSNGFNKALELNGSQVKGWQLAVSEAKPRSDDSGSRGRSGRRGGGSGGKHGGRGGSSGARFGGRGGRGGKKV